MNSLTAEQARSLETVLIERETQLSAEIAAERDATRQRDAARSAEVIDRKADADQGAAEEVAEAETQRDIDELKAVQTARQRMTAGLYGQCVDCEEPIAFARLQAQPAAIRCARCQTGYEEKMSLTR